MFEYLYEWLRNISYYLILVTAVTYVLPSGSYRKYIRFFTGLVLILMLLTPVLNLFGKNEGMAGNLAKKYYEEFEKDVADHITWKESLSEEKSYEKADRIKIEVEEIIIEP